MNPVEIEEAVSSLALEPFDRAEFPFQFLAAFDNPETTLKRLRSGATNASDLPGGVLQRNNIHIATCAPGEVDATLKALRDSPKTASAKAKFILATDGETFQAEDLNGGGTVACAYAELADHFGFFLPLAGITTVHEVRESAFDVKATGRLNRLYVQLLKENPDWASAERQHDMNHFMARLIFCFFAEDTGIFANEGMFTKTVEQMTAGDAASLHTVISEIFRAMDTRPEDLETAGLPRYAAKFPYVNGQLFSGSTEVPTFSKVARSYLLHIGGLNWKKINPDIFGSMIQAVTDDEERGALGMHYTSVPNILKVLNPLFLDDLREKLEAAGDNPRKLLNLRNRMARIRVFDPACGSGNFLVIAYKEMRAIEAEINKRREEPDRRSDIPLTNFRGIELRDFPAEIARLALIIAEYQCDVIYRGLNKAIADFLPLDSENWITCGNALRLDWLGVCRPIERGVRITSDDLFQNSLTQTEIDFDNEGGETYICGNPPYLGSQWQSEEQKNDLRHVFEYRTNGWRSLDYVAGWFLKAADYGKHARSSAGFVSTNSICQGRQVDTLWSILLNDGIHIHFTHTSFRWSNLANHSAGVTVVIIGITRDSGSKKIIFSEEDGKNIRRNAQNINPYLTSGSNLMVRARSKPLSTLPEMAFGSMPNEGGHLLLPYAEAAEAIATRKVDPRFVRRFLGSQEFIRGIERRCIWVTRDDAEDAKRSNWLNSRFDAVQIDRLDSKRPATKELAKVPYQFGEVRQTGNERSIVIPRVSSENRSYLPVGIVDEGAIIGDRNFALYDAPLWNMALIASRLHWVWIGTVCVRMRTDFSYSNTLGWNTFPIPKLTEQNKADLTRCAENILLAREAHFPATIADLYDPDAMPEDLRRAHEANDETLERIYIGRRFRNDTERLEKLFELYTRMTSKPERT